MEYVVEYLDASCLVGEDVVHHYPIFGREHVFEMLDCWCHPQPAPENPFLIVHNAEN